jgi:magnesium transporter
MPMQRKGLFRSRMLRKALFRKRHPPAGAQPGTLVVPDAAGPPRIHIISYANGALDECDVDTLDAATAWLRDDRVTWIDIRGLGDEAFLRGLGQLFQLHPLALEDLVNIPQRPKLEAFTNHLMLITRMLRLRPEGQVDHEQVSLVVGPNYVLTLQERDGDVFDGVRARIRQGGPVFRTSGNPYLMYALLDAIIDAYFPVLESLGDRIAVFEDVLIDARQTPPATEIYALRRELLGLRHVLWAQREVLSTLRRDDGPLDTRAVVVHLRDCHDHCVQALEVVESYRDLSRGLLDLLMAAVANRQSDVMKTLTIVATLFIPLTFLAGIYGMNFTHMPELHTRWGYPALLGVMLLVTGGMLLYFRRKGWLGGDSDSES